MPPRKQTSKPQDEGHLPVTNREPEEIVRRRPARLVQQAAEGDNPNPNPVTPEGAEQVRGHEKAKGLLAELWTAPETKLPDIGEASFGKPHTLQEIVHGPDDRVQIDNTAIYPWRAHASLEITAADNSLWIGTGWFIGPHTLMTAGHVVHIKNSGVPGLDGWVKKIRVMPGRNGTLLPYGAVSSTQFWSVRGWTEGGEESYDYGAIILPNDLGLTTGWFGFGVWTDAQLVSATGNIAGYPGDKDAGTQWYDWQCIASVDGRNVYYDIDTAGGQSGSAVYRILDGGRYAIAIHAYGGATTNHGARITAPVYNNMLAWKA